MKIVMLGTSSAGKTTYMAAMYETGHAGVRGFRIRAKSPQREAELLRNAAALRHGTYPPPSARHSAHEFVLSHRGREVLDFIWNDYRGGALTERSTEHDAALVLDDLVTADGIVVFVDAAALAVAEDQHRRLRRLTVLMQRALDRDIGRTVPFVLAYTKADLVGDDPAVWHSLGRPVQPLVEIANAAPHVIPTVVAVSCGRRPRNVDVPLLWCLSHALTAEIVRRENAVSAATAAERQARAKASVVDSVSAYFNGRESYAKQAEAARKQAQQELAELQPLIRPAERLAATVIRRHRAGADTVRAVRSVAHASGEERRARQARQAVANLWLLLLFVGMAVGAVVTVANLVSR